MTEGSWVPKTWATFPTAWLQPPCTQVQEELQVLSQILFLFRATGPVHTKPSMDHRSRARGQGNNSSMQEWNEVWTKPEAPHSPPLAVSILTRAASHVPQKPAPYHLPENRKKQGGSTFIQHRIGKVASRSFCTNLMSNAECKTSIFSVNITKEKSEFEEC